MTVVDASIVVEALVAQTPLGQLARDRLSAADGLFSPHLMDVEATNALRGLARGNKIELGLAATAVKQLADLPVVRLPHQPFLSRIWELRDQLSAYDAAYVSVAEAVGEPLITADARLAAATGVACDIELLG